MVGSVVSPRTLGSVMLAVIAVLLVVWTTPAAAVEASATEGPTEDHASPTIEEIGSGSQTAAEHLPEPTDLPPFQRFLYIPLIIGGIVIVGLLLFRYLQWQPRFAEERRSKRRR